MVFFRIFTSGSWLVWGWGLSPLKNYFICVGLEGDGGGLGGGAGDIEDTAGGQVSGELFLGNLRKLGREYWHISDLL